MEHTEYTEVTFPFVSMGGVFYERTPDNYFIKHIKTHVIDMRFIDKMVYIKTKFEGFN